MIKGRYVATVTIDFNLPDDLANGLPIDELKKRLIVNADNTLRRIVEDGCDSDRETVDIQQQYADLYIVTDEMEDEHVHEHDQN